MNALFYKEWIKTRWYILLSVLVSIGFSGYTMLRINRVAELKGIAHVWEVMLTHDVVFVDIQEFIPVLIGICLALIQFVPEMYHKCLKLTLHLPFSQQRITNTLTTYGVLVLVASFAMNFLIMFVYMQRIFPVELYGRVLITALPWYLAGITAYLLMAWICLEPTWKFRIVNLIISILLLRIFFLSVEPEAYTSFIPTLIIAIIAISTLPHLSVDRFKRGEQD